MLFNKTKMQERQTIDCLSCPYFNKFKKKCDGGIGKICFEYDPKKQTIIDPKTKLPIKIN